MAFGTFGLEIAQNAKSCSKGKKLIKVVKVARNMKRCQNVASQLVDSPRLTLYLTLQ